MRNILLAAVAATTLAVTAIPASAQVYFGGDRGGVEFRFGHNDRGWHRGWHDYGYAGLSLDQRAVRQPERSSDHSARTATATSLQSADSHTRGTPAGVPFRFRQGRSFSAFADSLRLLISRLVPASGRREFLLSLGRLRRRRLTAGPASLAPAAMTIDPRLTRSRVTGASGSVRAEATAGFRAGRTGSV